MKTSEKQLVSKLAKHPKETLATMDENAIANVIQLANYHYYNTDKPLFADNVFDMIKEYLQDKNPYHPILKHVGAIVDDDRKIKLPYWMGSMDKIKSDGAVISKWKKNYSGKVIISDKLDGNSGMVYFKGGKTNLFTRGNGVEGQKIDHLLPFIRNIPNFETTKFKKYPEFTVRGELIINKEDFHKVADLGANGRNMVAGLLNAKIPNLEIAKYCQFVAYELVEPRMEPSKQFTLMHKMGFKCVWTMELSVADVDATRLSQILLERRGKSEFEIDGIIVAHDHLHNRMDGENPKYAFAFKSVAMMDRAEVIVTGVEWNVSKDGYIKPVVLFDGVNLSGAVVKRATGFNAKFIVTNKIGVGAKIVVMRSGAVIPHIVETVEPSGEPAMPDIRYKWNDSGIDIVADENNAKDELQLQNLVFFFTTIKVVGLSAGLLAKFQEAGLDEVGKILDAKLPDLLKVSGFKDKMAAKVFEAIKTRFAEVSPLELMKASNQFGRGIGSTKLGLVSAAYPDMLSKKDFKVGVPDLVKIDGIEKKTAEAILAGLPKYWQFAAKNGLLKYHKVAAPAPNVANVNKPAAKQTFTGKGFLFTGVRSKVAEDFIKEHGGVIKSSMSKNVNVLICKDPSSTSGKMQEAREMGVNIMSLGDFAKEHNITL